MIELHVSTFPSLEGIFPVNLFDIWAYPVGSRHVCNPPVMDTDEDYLIYSPGLNLSPWLEKAGFEDEAETAPGAYDTSSNRFTSWRRGNLNLIVTSDAAFAAAYQAATLVCAKFNVRDKVERVRLYEAIVEGKPENMSVSDVEFFPL